VKGLYIYRYGTVPSEEELITYALDALRTEFALYRETAEAIRLAKVRRWDNERKRYVYI
jgi:hypothetical protein